ncbi:nuclear transport factor 2 family protein [Thiomicrorhabdus sp.]|uniref:nuclear transport factor 2 family protein n=1 Tax=Thiomicrorhabdus sp. TaxID=2039724 RepID=UPI002AA82BBF|nr:nuclear transport factor 2 family protein [Thiomicrorhabdus sp.]
MLNNLSSDQTPINDASIKTPLNRYIKVFENLTEQTLISELLPLLCEQIHFKDPFNDVIGKKATFIIFKHMFSTLDDPKFLVKHSALENHTAYLHWQFTFYLKNSAKQQKIDGLSQVTFNSTGLVKAHIDYWDPAEQVYSQVPILNWLIRLVAKRLSAKNE